MWRKCWPGSGSSILMMMAIAGQNHYYATTLRFVIHFTAFTTCKTCTWKQCFFQFSYSTDPKATAYHKVASILKVETLLGLHLIGLSLSFIQRIIQFYFYTEEKTTTKKIFKSLSLFFCSTFLLPNYWFPAGTGYIEWFGLLSAESCFLSCA